MKTAKNHGSLSRGQKNKFPAVALGLSLAMTAGAQAVGADVNWDGGGSGDLWSTGDNWDTNLVPTGDTEITGAYLPELENDVSNIEVLRVGGGATLTVKTGADLTITASKAFSEEGEDPNESDQWGAFAVGVNSTGTVVQQAGTVTTAGADSTLFVGMNVVEIGDTVLGTGGVGTYTLQGGTLAVGKQLRLGAAGGIGTFNLEGGSLTTVNSLTIGIKGESGGIAGTGIFVISGGSVISTPKITVGETGSTDGTATLRIVGANATISTGDYRQEGDFGTLELEFGSGGISTIVCSGDAKLNGSAPLAVTLGGGFVLPSTATDYDIITALNESLNSDSFGTVTIDGVDIDDAANDDWSISYPDDQIVRLTYAGTGTAASTAAITSITVAGTTATIDMTGVDGTDYTCESSIDLVDWATDPSAPNPIDTSTGISGEATFTVDSTPVKKFYRIAE